MHDQKTSLEGENIRGFCDAPFYHRVIDDFLSKEDFDELCEITKGSKFYEKHSDLFHFYQTNELKDDKKFSRFLAVTKEEMEKDLKTLNKEVKKGEMDLFGSFYGPGHFLLPHDDCISQRVLAFSFYLNDPNVEENNLNVKENGNNIREGKASSHVSSNGELALYEADGQTLSKLISPLPNRLVIFEVSGKSYHEVKMMRQGHRMALTGWLRSKEYSPETIVPAYRPVKYWFFHSHLVVEECLLGEPQIFSVPQCAEPSYLDGAVRLLEGLKWKKRLNCIYTSLDEPEESENGEELTAVPLELISFLGKELVDTLVGRINPGAYLLLNDPFNRKSDILVILSLYEGLIQIINSEGEPVGKIKKPGHYIWPANGSFYIPPGNKTGYIVAYRMNI